MLGRRRYLLQLGGLFSVAGGLLLGTGAHTSQEAARTSDISVEGDSSAFLGVDSAYPPKIVIGDGSDTVNDLVAATNNLSETADVTFTDLTASSDDIALHDGSGEVGDTHTVSGVGSGSSASIDVAIPESESLPNGSLDFEVRSESGGTTVTVVRSLTIENGLIGYYPFEGDPSGTDGTVPDKSGNGNDGTTRNGVDTGADGSEPPSKIGEAFGFGGANEKVEIPDNSDLLSDDTSMDFSGDFTLAAWGRTGSSGLMNVFYKYGSGNGYRLGMDGGTYEATVWDGDTNYQLSSSNTFHDSVYHHVTMVRDGATLRLYVDGSERGTTTATTGDLTNTESLYLGNNSGSDGWNGPLDDMRLYERALTGAEIQDLYDLTFND